MKHEKIISMVLLGVGAVLLVMSKYMVMYSDIYLYAGCALVLVSLILLGLMKSDCSSNRNNLIPAFNELQNTAVVGNDLTEVSGTVNDCNAACYANPSCVGYNRDSTQPNNAYTSCWLKNKIVSSPNTAWNLFVPS